MMKKIPVRIGIEILIIVYGIFLHMVYQIKDEPNPGNIAVAIFYLIFVSISIFGIRYEIKGQELWVRNGIFGTTKVDITLISSIEKSSNLLSSPAPSVLGRVEIFYKDRSIVISPKNYQELRDTLLAINPEITVNA